MHGHFSMGPLVVGLAVMFLLIGCAGSASPSATSAAATPTSVPSVAAATPLPTATSARTSAGSGHVIHVNVLVPLASAAALGSACDAAALRATGPKAAAIPGSRLVLYDIARAGRDVFPPAEAPATADTSATAETSATNQPSEPIHTNEPTTPLGEQPVPQTGTVVKPISDDPSFPAACRFSFDVPTTADPDKGYVFGVGSIYFPIPLMLRADLETAGWVATIGVNPQ
jgi:hypothetical protein